MILNGPFRQDNLRSIFGGLVDFWSGQYHIRAKPINISIKILHFVNTSQKWSSKIFFWPLATPEPVPDFPPGKSSEWPISYQSKAHQYGYQNSSFCQYISKMVFQNIFLATGHSGTGSGFPPG
uniref:(northern house mosquito) hypothetical protein n=1 Tax=Culex pipiens TaxID=7175 RepID=A0A8D8KA88_CULPI